MNGINDKTFLYVLGKAITGFRPDVKNFWNLCRSKYESYAKDVVADIVARHEYYKQDELAYKELADSVKWDNDNWETLTGNWNGKLSGVIDNQVNYYEDKEIYLKDGKQELLQKLVIRMALVRQFAYSYYSSFKENRPITSEQLAIWKQREEEPLIVGRNKTTEKMPPFGRWHSSQKWSQFHSTESESKNTCSFHTLPIPMAIKRLHDEELIQETEEGSHVFINQKGSLVDLKRVIITRGLVMPENKDIATYIRYEKNGELFEYDPSTIRKAFPQSERMRNSVR